MFAIDKKEKRIVCKDVNLKKKVRVKRDVFVETLLGIFAVDFN